MFRQQVFFSSLRILVGEVFFIMLLKSNINLIIEMKIYKKESIAREGWDRNNYYFIFAHLQNTHEII